MPCEYRRKSKKNCLWATWCWWWWKKNDSSFVNDLSADSLDTVELVIALEEEFELEIADEEAEKISTVQEAVDYINSNS